MSIGILEIIFQRKNSKYDILNHLYFGPYFAFCRQLQGVLKKLPMALQSKEYQGYHTGNSFYIMF